MTQRRTTYYVCDACGKQSTVKKDVRRMTLRIGTPSARDVISGDLCAACEGAFIEAAAVNLPELAEKILALRREGVAYP